MSEARQFWGLRGSVFLTKGGPPALQAFCFGESSPALGHQVIKS